MLTEIMTSFKNYNLIFLYKYTGFPEYRLLCKLLCTKTTGLRNLKKENIYIVL
jgi:hypothetical protein